MPDLANLPALLQSFFTTRLMTQRKVSPHTIASYRDTFRLLLQFAQKRLRKAPSQLALHDLDASLVGAFLEDLENRRRNGAKSRNLRLTAIRSFFRYAALEAPAQSGIIQRVLAIPNQRQRRTLVGFPTRPEIEALLDPACWTQRAPRRIERSGWDAVTMPFRSPPCRPDCDCPR
jgi:integrase/recombinase XerD